MPCIISIGANGRTPLAYVFMPCSASAGAAETADGAVARMRMVLSSFTIAYYTKNLPRNLPRDWEPISKLSAILEFCRGLSDLANSANEIKDGLITWGQSPAIHRASAAIHDARASSETPATMAASAIPLRARLVSWKNLAPRRNVSTTDRRRISEAAEIGEPG